jgi:hypothetical protein
VTQSNARTARIDLTAKGGGSSPRGDLRKDAVVRDLVGRDDTERDSAELRLALAGISGAEHEAIARPRIDIDFTEGSIALHRFVPERTLIALDRIVHTALSS